MSDKGERGFFGSIVDILWAIGQAFIHPSGPPPPQNGWEPNRPGPYGQGPNSPYGNNQYGSRY